MAARRVNMCEYFARLTKPLTTSIVFTCSRPLMSVTEGRPAEVLGVWLEVESLSTSAKDVVLGVTFGLSSGALLALGVFDAFEKTRSAPCKKVLWVLLQFSFIQFRGCGQLRKEWIPSKQENTKSGVCDNFRTLCWCFLLEGIASPNRMISLVNYQRIIAARFLRRVLLIMFLWNWRKGLSRCFWSVDTWAIIYFTPCT